MSRNSPSARKHRALRFLAHLVHYKTYGPLAGPKEAHQPDRRWPTPPCWCGGATHRDDDGLVWCYENINHDPTPVEP